MKLLACTLLLIVTALLIPATIWGYDGEPSDDEIVSWWAGMSTEDRLEQLRNLDRYEHELPEINFPTFDVLVTDDQILMRPRAPLTIWLYTLGWTVTVPEQTAAYEPIKPNLWDVGVPSFVIGILIGLGLSLLIP